MADRCEDKDSPFLEFRRALRKRAKKKYVSNSLALALAEVPNTPLRTSYWNTWHCSEVIEVADGRATSAYCKNRWCLQCQSIRIATLINKYRAAIEELPDPYFVTLTAPNVEGWDLKNEIERFRECWRKITHAGRQRKGFKGLRKCECTARPGNEFHYHFHIIVDGKENAEWLLKRWLRLNLHVNASPKAQDLRPLDKNGLVELFKYFTKLTAYDTQEKRRKMQDPRALDLIFQSMRGTRVFQSFGGFVAIDEEEFDMTAENTELANGVYAWYSSDWFKMEVDGSRSETGITGFVPSAALNEFWNIEQ